MQLTITEVTEVETVTKGLVSREVDIATIAAHDFRLLGPN